MVPPGLRIHERRHHDLSDQPPPLDRELRHLRLMVLDAHGARGISLLAERAGATALLAQACGEFEVADILEGLTESLLRGHNSDPRTFIYDQLDRLNGVRTPH